MAVSAQLYELVETTVKGVGYELVDVERFARGIIRVTIDQEGGITLNDCEVVSNLLNPTMTVEGIDFDRLEVSSPGVDRPLRKVADFKRFAGNTAHIELFTPIYGEGLPENGRRRMDVRIVDVVDDQECPIINVEILAERPALTPSAKSRMSNKKKMSNDQKENIKVGIPYKEIEQATLIAELDFRGRNK
ncbi:MAG: ribosome maturation factor RimP [Burkholderiaceae bacterium]|nr:ribosome maturation factor RimP [Burkholderiaceae bacterium]